MTIPGIIRRWISPCALAEIARDWRNNKAGARRFTK